MDMGKNILIMVMFNLKVNIQMEKEMEKGKEYNINNEKLKFEGEYLNGKRNGKGKEYYDNGKLKFEVEYLKGENWKGIGNDFNSKGILISKSKYLNGKKK